MTPVELKAFRKAKRITQGELAILLKVSRKTVVNWEGAIFAIPSDMVERLTLAGVLDKPELSKAEREIMDARVAGYRKMRRTWDHARCISLWAQAGNAPFTPDEQAAILAEFPDILNHGETK